MEYSRRSVLQGIGAALLALPESLPAQRGRAMRPNIILILTDDQGYGDLGRHGNPVLQTPHLDRLYDESVRFDRFCVSPTCSPTRCALMTGKHEFKSGVTHTIYERERMSLQAYTLPQLLKSGGYTTGIFGKWHLGDEDEYQPDRRGFDEVYIHGGGGIGQTYPGSCGDAPGNTYFNPALLHNGVFEKTTGYCTDLFFAQAIRWIDDARKKGPFFAYIATNAPHTPLQCPEEYRRKYADKGLTDDQMSFFGMVTNIDDNVGRLLERLREWGIERDTLVIFLTDNGGTVGRAVYNAGMRTGKVTPYEGGVRAISLWRWPGAFNPATVNTLTAHMDVFPTLAALTETKPPSSLPLEGRSLLPLLKDPNAPWADRYLFTHVGRWEKGRAAESKYAKCSVRDRRFRFVNNAELYDIENDPGETKNVLAEHPDVVTALRYAYDLWWDEVLPCLENENVVGPAENPFKVRYWRQFGKA
jgi:arylsulfatase A-like enzyme